MGLTQAATGIAAGTDGANLSKIEAGRVDVGTYRLAALALALNCSADYLLGLTDDPKPHWRT